MISNCLSLTRNAWHAIDDQFSSGKQSICSSKSGGILIVFVFLCAICLYCNYMCKYSQILSSSFLMPSGRNHNWKRVTLYKIRRYVSLCNRLIICEIARWKGEPQEVIRETLSQRMARNARKRPGKRVILGTQVSTARYRHIQAFYACVLRARFGRASAHQPSPLQAPPPPFDHVGRANQTSIRAGNPHAARTWLPLAEMPGGTWSGDRKDRSPQRQGPLTAGMVAALPRSHSGLSALRVSFTLPATVPRQHPPGSNCRTNMILRWQPRLLRGR